MPIGGKQGTRAGKLGTGLLASMMVLTGLAAVLAPANLATAAHDNPADQTRLAFAHAPVPTDLDATYPGIYMSPFAGAAAPGVTNSTLRVYGEEGKRPAETYYTDDQGNHVDVHGPNAAVATGRDLNAPWRPEVIPKDSVTFNPALISHEDPDFTGHSPGQPMSWLQGCDGDGELKKNLRLWYEPDHDFLGPRTDAGLFTPPAEADVVHIESTYSVLDSSSHEIQGFCDGSQFPWPTEGTFANISDDDTTDACPCNVTLTLPIYNQPGVDTMRAVTARNVTPDVVGPSTGEVITRATVRLERSVRLKVGDEVQFLDHVFQYRGTGMAPDGSTAALFRVFYAGNNFLDVPADHVLVQAGNPDAFFFDRHNNVYTTSQHDTPANIRTSYLKITFFNPSTPAEVQVVVGKELQSGDIYYVDGVRYEVAFLAVTPGPAPVLESITLRTPIPKSDPQGTWTSMPDELVELPRERLINGQWQVVEFSTVTTQYISEVDVTDPIPLNPPFNHETYRQVDDTDVILWKPGEEANSTNFPWGPKLLGNGLPKYELGHTYLTREPPADCFATPAAAIFCDWINFYQAERTNNETAANTPRRWSDETGINRNGTWITQTEFNRTRINFDYEFEWCENRYNTNLQEVLEEPEDEWTRFEYNSHPCQYTEFVFPNRSNPVSELIATLDTDFEGEPGAGTYRIAGGDYFVETSFRLQDGATRFGFAYDPEDNNDADLNSMDQVDLYVNPASSAFNNLRLYGEPGFGAPLNWTDPEDAFNPTAIPKDSATFNPAIIVHSQPDFTGYSTDFAWITGCDGDANLKKHLRSWYEPDHEYLGPRVPTLYNPPTQADVIQMESTYIMVDAASYDPVHMCAGQSALPFPTEGNDFFLPDDDPADDCTCGIQLTGHQQPGLDAMERITVDRVFGTTGTNGGADLVREVTLTKGGVIQLFDRIYQFRGTVSDGSGSGPNQAFIVSWYAGNTGPDVPTAFGVDGNRVYIHRNGATAPGVVRPSMVQSSWIEMVFFNDDIARLRVGKEIHQDDIFYTDGVRYEVPAMYVVGGELKYITLRTPLPKSSPETGAWTSVPDDQVAIGREALWNGQFQVQDFSVVSTQYLVNINASTPIPVNPPFNNVGGYSQVDDTDVILWRQGPLNTRLNFPLGPANSVLPGGNGQNLFPLGHTYVTRDRPACLPAPATPEDAVFCAWIDYFDAIPSGAAQLRNRIGATPELPINVNTTWNPGGLPNGPGNFGYTREWCDDRLNTNVVEVANETNEAWEKIEVNSLPCEYTEFYFPDRNNTVSDALSAVLYPFGGAGTSVDLGAGDYLVMTSLILEEDGGFVSGTSPSFDAYDANRDCSIQTVPELIQAIKDWIAGRIGNGQLLATALNWLASPGYC